MSGSKSVRPVSSILLSTFLLGILATASFAQNASPQTVPNNPPLTPLPQAPAPQHNAHLYADQDYTRGKRQFPNPFVVYTVRDVAPLNVTNSARIDQLIKDGKMYLSLNDAVAMALENNLDIGIQRYNLSIADTDILRTSSGAVALGVNAGLVQGTPGGSHRHDLGRWHWNLHHGIDRRRRGWHDHRSWRRRCGRGRHCRVHAGRRPPDRQL